MKKLLIIFLALLIALFFVACPDDPASGDGGDAGDAGDAGDGGTDAGDGGTDAGDAGDAGDVTTGVDIEIRDKSGAVIANGSTHSVTLWELIEQSVSLYIYNPGTEALTISDDGSGNYIMLGGDTNFELGSDLSSYSDVIEAGGMDYSFFSIDFLGSTDTASTFTETITINSDAPSPDNVYSFTLEVSLDAAQEITLPYSETGTSADATYSQLYKFTSTIGNEYEGEYAETTADGVLEAYKADGTKYSTFYVGGESTTTDTLIAENTTTYLYVRFYSFSQAGSYDLGVTDTSAPEIEVTNPDGGFVSTVYSAGDVDASSGVATDFVFTIDNIGEAQLDITSITVDDTNAETRFTVTGPVANSLQPEENTTFTVTFTGDDSAGAASESITIESNDPDNSSMTFDVDVNAVLPYSEISIFAPDSSELVSGTSNYDLGMADLSATKDYVFTVENVGVNTSFDITAINLTGSGLITNSDTTPITVDAGASADLTLTFTGDSSTTGDITATIEVVNDETGITTGIGDETDEQAFTFDVTLTIVTEVWSEDFESDLSAWTFDVDNAVDPVISDGSATGEDLISPTGTQMARLGTPESTTGTGPEPGNVDDSITEDDLPGHSNFIEMSTDITGILSAEGTLNFDYVLYAEGGGSSGTSDFDVLKVTVDGTGGTTTLVGIKSAEWQTGSITVPSDATTLTFRYKKDSTVTKGEDCVWLDNLAIVE